MESVEGLGVNFTAAFDVEGYFKSLTLLHDGHMPYDVKPTFTIFRGHLHVVSLSIGALKFPILDFELWWKHVVDVQVAQSGIAVVLEQNEHFVATLSSKRNGLLSCAEISSVVNDLDRRGRFRLPGADGPKALGTELNASWGIHTVVAWRGIGCVQGVGDLNLLARFESEWTSCANGQGHGVALAVRRAVFLLDGHAFRHFHLELVVIHRFPIQFHGQLLMCWSLKQPRDVVGDAHQIDGR